MIRIISRTRPMYPSESLTTPNCQKEFTNRCQIKVPTHLCPEFEIGANCVPPRQTTFIHPRKPVTGLENETKKNRKKTELRSSKADIYPVNLSRHFCVQPFLRSSKADI